MMALSMFYAGAAGLLLVLAAMCGERAAALGGRARRWGWAAALVLTLTLPIVSPLRSTSEPVMAVTAIHSADAATAGSLARWRVSAVGAWRSNFAARLPDLDQYNVWLAVTWLSTSLVVALWYLGGVVALARRRSLWRRALVQGHTVVVSAATGPAVVGVWRPEIVLPEWATSLDARSLEMILRHEEEHVRAGDHWLVHFTRVAVVAMPWNPAVWWMASRLRLAVEIDCDARVLASGDGVAVDASAYATLLLAVASRPVRTAGVMSPALIDSSTSLFRRVVAMCPADVRFPRAQVCVAIVGALALCAAACEAPAPTGATATETAAVVQGPGVAAPSPTPVGPTPPATAGPEPSSASTPDRESSAAPRRGNTAGASTPSVRPTTGPQPSSASTPDRESSAAPRRGNTAEASTPSVRPDVFRPGAGITNPVPIEQPRPRYTPAALREKLQGRVELEVVVETDGTVSDVVVVRSLDPQFGLDASAIDAAKRWRFQPATRDGQPVAVVVTLDLEFAIH